MTEQHLSLPHTTWRVGARTRQVAAVLVGLVLLAGCGLTQPPPVKESFMLASRAAPTASPRPHAATLRIGSFGVVAPFEGRGIVFRTTEVNYQSDFYNEFFVAPGAMVRERVGAYLTAARPFRSIALDPRVAGRYQLRGVVTQMLGDVRHKAAPAAVLAIHFYLVATDPPADRLVYDRLVEQRVALPDTSARAVVDGLGAALDQVLATLADDLGRLDLAALEASAPRMR
ncbi:membrane integrity-associated transporter subunit PqiC [Schlegelella sp. ID0723]|uniref:Membrane integrity-associated transporter subunit PqiC n=2 Tax=Piscinibacter koreensis TaxID=2742824 RepID=A0A7Y6NR75_9BURK|nr:membrane integrity-associated transporter subunit PqiC [Schlegelella koreensis]